MSQLPDVAIARLRTWAIAGEGLATLVVRAMADVMEREVRSQLTRQSHDVGTPTPSAPGDPPAMVTGRLAGHVTIREVGPGRVQVGSTVPYARIHEFGGVTGRGGATTLPPRPYLRPARKLRLEAAVEAAMKIIERELRA